MGKKTPKKKPPKPSKTKEARELRKRRGVPEVDRQFRPSRDVTFVTK